jgi:hypothetical protein
MGKFRAVTGLQNRLLLGRTERLGWFGTDGRRALVFAHPAVAGPALNCAPTQAQNLTGRRQARPRLLGLLDQLHGATAI